MVASHQQSTRKDEKQGSLITTGIAKQGISRGLVFIETTRPQGIQGVLDDTQHWPQHHATNDNRNAQDIGCDQSCGTGRVEQQSPERSTISLRGGGGRPFQHKPKRELRSSAMEAIEHHSNPESDEPDQAKRMQTSLSHLMPGQSNGKDHREGHIASRQGNMAEERPIWLFTGQEHHGRNLQSHRRLGTCTGQQGDDSRRLLRLQQSVRPGEPLEADAETQETATTILHIIDSTMAE